MTLNGVIAPSLRYFAEFDSFAVCPSVQRVICDKTKENCAAFLHHIKDHLP